MNYYEQLTEEHFTRMLRELYGPSGMLHEHPSKLYNKELKANNSEMKQGLKIEYTNKSYAYGDSRYYVYYVDGQSVFTATQIPWPNCCGIAILKDVNISSSVSKDLFKNILDEICEDLYRNDKYSKLLFYTNIGSVSRMFETYPDITILNPFKNRRSGNILIGFEINLLKESDINPRLRSEWTSDIDEEEDDSDDDDESEENDEEDERQSIREIVEAHIQLDGLVANEPTPDVVGNDRRHVTYGSYVRFNRYLFGSDPYESTNTR